MTAEIGPTRPGDFVPADVDTRNPADVLRLVQVEIDVAEHPDVIRCNPTGSQGQSLSALFAEAFLNLINNSRMQCRAAAAWSSKPGSMRPTHRSRRERLRDRRIHDGSCLRSRRGTWQRRRSQNFVKKRFDGRTAS